MQLSARALDRTLLLRQHLLERADVEPLKMVEQLIGLQAQDNLPPYLALAARVEGFDPRTLSAHLEHREAVRILSLRGTLHLLSVPDALALRTWVQPVLDRAREPRPPATVAPLVQQPPRGLWRRSGGVSYAPLEEWVGAPATDVDLPALVRRWLRAYGPATAADMTTWSGVTRLGPVFARLDLVEHTGPDGKVLYDVPDAPIADEEVPAPPRLLGVYDNVWLSHAKRDRVLSGESRTRWAGPNGGVGNVVLLDGAGAGRWWVADGRVEVELWRRATPRERADLDDEVGRVEALLALP